jgi:MFS family permease
LTPNRFTNQYEMTLLIGIVYGIGNAAFQTISFAVVTDIMPSLNPPPSSVTKIRTLYNGFILGVNNAIQCIPALVAPIIDGILIDQFPGKFPRNF